MNGVIERKLKVLRDFQLKHPTSHIGGSIGLLIRGVDLKRSLHNSDLDITIDEYNGETTEWETRSDASDFDFAYKITHDNGQYTRIDIRITPEPSFDVMEFNGHTYNVSKLRDILFWKQKYANKGVKKHENDLIAMKTGKRPIDEAVLTPIDNLNLPF